MRKRFLLNSIRLQLMVTIIVCMLMCLISIDVNRNNEKKKRYLKNSLHEIKDSVDRTFGIVSEAVSR